MSFNEYIRCPITKDIFLDPVVAEDGHIYERTAIEKWFKTHSISPMTGTKINNKIVFPVFHIKKIINDLITDNPKLKEEQYQLPKLKFKKHIKLVYQLIDNNQFNELLKYDEFDLKKFNRHKLIKLLKKCKNNNIIKYFIDNIINVGVKILIKVRHNKTPVYGKLLHLMARYSTIENIKYLLNNKRINIMSKTSDNNFVTHLACYNNLDTLKLFIDNGVPINTPNSFGNYPIHIACWENKLDIIKYLIEKYKVDINCKNNHGFRPIHYLCKYGSFDSIEYFLKQNVNINCRTNKGNYPIELLKYNKHKNVSEIGKKILLMCG